MLEVRKFRKLKGLERLFTFHRKSILQVQPILERYEYNGLAKGVSSR